MNGNRASTDATEPRPTRPRRPVKTIEWLRKALSSPNVVVGFMCPLNLSFSLSCTDRSAAIFGGTLGETGNRPGRRQGTGEPWEHWGNLGGTLGEPWGYPGNLEVSALLNWTEKQKQSTTHTTHQNNKNTQHKHTTQTHTTGNKHTNTQQCTPKAIHLSNNTTNSSASGTRCPGLGGWRPALGGRPVLGGRPAIGARRSVDHNQLSLQSWCSQIRNPPHAHRL